MCLTCYPMGKPTRLFVYGTLKRGGMYHDYLGRAKYLGQGTVKGRLFVRTIPYLFEGDNLIKGEIYEVNDAEFNRTQGMEESAGYITSYEEVSGIADVAVFRMKPEYLEQFASDPSFIEATEYSVEQ